MFFARASLISSLFWLAMSSRANTQTHVARIRRIGSEADKEFRVTVTKMIAFGARMALEQCKEQFKWDRWNCPESAFSSRYDSPTSREMAYVSSVTAAGIVHAVTRGCSRGSTPLCGCVKDAPSPSLDFKGQRSNEENESVRSEWEWRGCSDDITMGSLVAKTFLEALEGPSADVLSKVNLHNSKLGLAVVRDSIMPECRCHGVSGSCTTKTCWRRVEPFQKIGHKLKRRFARAMRIQVNRPQSSLAIPESRMVFLDESPDYCKANSTTGWMGTGGRVCSRGRFNNTDKAEKRSCRKLCRSCGHQVKRRRVKESWDCNCKFLWCCQVECTTCHRTVVQRYCDDTPRKF